MRPKNKRHVIYVYKKSKSGRKKSVKHNNISFNFILLALSGLLFLSIPGYYFLGFQEEVSYGSLFMAKKIGILSAQSKKTSLPSGFTLGTSLPPLKKITPTVSPEKNVNPIIPIAQAQNIPNDFCLNVPVLLYHHIQPFAIAKELGQAQLTVDSDYFDKHMAYLAANGYYSISADELADALIQHRNLPAKSILVTFDDGYEDNYTYAFQTLKKYNIVGNYMIPTGLIENKGYMSWSQIKEIADTPLMHIYNHTWSHAFLGTEAKDKIEFEIVTANKQLENNLGNKVRIFTYPYGSFNQLMVSVLREQGFSAAFSTINGTLQCESYIFALRRTHIGNAPLSSYGF